jgi:hypothetical protein
MKRFFYEEPAEGLPDTLRYRDKLLVPHLLQNKKPSQINETVFLRRAGGGTRTHDLLITNQLL